jgi:hypothetical protein
VRGRRARAAPSRPFVAKQALERRVALDLLLAERSVVGERLGSVAPRGSRPLPREVSRDDRRATIRSAPRRVVLVGRVMKWMNVSWVTSAACVVEPQYRRAIDRPHRNAAGRAPRTRLVALPHAGEEGELGCGFRGACAWARVSTPIARAPEKFQPFLLGVGLAGGWARSKAGRARQASLMARMRG